LIGFGARLIEPLAQVLAIEADEIDDGLRGDAHRLPSFQVEGKAGVARQLPLPQHLVGHAFVSCGFRGGIAEK
jgi:hypothetical protein